MHSQLQGNVLKIKKQPENKCTTNLSGNCYYWLLSEKRENGIISWLQSELVFSYQSEMLRGATNQLTNTTFKYTTSTRIFKTNTTQLESWRLLTKTWTSPKTNPHGHRLPFANLNLSFTSLENYKVSPNVFDFVRYK